MADTKDRSSAALTSDDGLPRRRNEDSGLIDLDALMRQASGDSQPAADAPPASTASGDRSGARRIAEVAPPASSIPAAATPAPVAQRAPEPAPASVPAVASTASTEAAPASVPAPVSAKAVPAAAKTQRSLDVGPASQKSKADDSLDGVASSAKPVAAKAADAATTDSVTAPATPAARKAQQPAEEEKKKKSPLLLLLLVAAVGGVGFLGLRAMRSTPPPAPVAVATQEPVKPAPVVTAEPKPEPTVEAKAEEPAPAAEAKDNKAPAKGAKVAAAKPGAKEENVKAEVTQTELTAAPTNQGDLASAMRGAVGPKEQAAEAAKVDTANPNARQLRPPPGQVVGAINSVLGAARECLGPDDGVRTGSIVFKNDGSVSSVSLAGAKPTDECVKSALSKARVQPFVDETFTTRITVRP